MTRGRYRMPGETAARERWQWGTVAGPPAAVAAPPVATGPAAPPCVLCGAAKAAHDDARCTFGYTPPDGSEARPGEPLCRYCQRGYRAHGPHGGPDAGCEYGYTPPMVQRAPEASATHLPPQPPASRILAHARPVPHSATTPLVTLPHPAPSRREVILCATCRRARSAHRVRADAASGACRTGYTPGDPKPPAPPPSAIPRGLVAIVDTREPDPNNPHDPSDKALGRARTPWVLNAATGEAERLYRVRAALPAGDYSACGLVDRIRIEWKDPGDLASTLFGRTRLASGEHVPQWERFQRELALLAAVKRPAIVVPCSRADILARNYVCQVEPLSVLGRCDRIWLDYGVPVLFCGSVSEAARTVGTLLRLAWEDEAEARKAKRKADEQVKP